MKMFFLTRLIILVIICFLVSSCDEFSQREARLPAVHVVTFYDLDGKSVKEFRVDYYNFYHLSNGVKVCTNTDNDEDVFYWYGNYSVKKTFELESSK